MEPKYDGVPLVWGTRLHPAVPEPGGPGEILAGHRVLGRAPGSLVSRLGEGAELLHAALVRNYPELTLARSRKAWTWATFAAVAAQLLQVSGLTRRPGGTAGGERPDWGYLYARVISLTGWTWEYVGREMTLPRLYEMQRYWQQHPPLGDLAAAYLGYESPVAQV